MEKLKNKEHDFSSKLRQRSVIHRLREYIAWHRSLETNPRDQNPPPYGPISINLDLTSACNFSCSYCVDSMILNTGSYLKLEEIKKTINFLHSKGLLSVILVGGGEPTLHKDFGEIVDYLKSKTLEVGIVTNGSRLDKVQEVADLLEKGDWVRISIDAAKQETFENLHRPKTDVTLDRILEKAKKLKERNAMVSLGYSFVIVWQGIDINGNRLSPNIDEMAESARLAREYAFDYVSFKPCLIRLEESQRESLLDHVNKETEKEIVKKIRMNLRKAKEVGGDKIKILESVNLKAMLNEETDRIKKQPKRCHMQFFRTVVAPSGIFHCPAFRGVEKAKIAGQDGYLTATQWSESLKITGKSISTFNAEEECKVVGCFYNQTNWWLEEFIQSDRDINEIETVEDHEFFL
jgi:MoaA/NifB/PqqE/SkfB family radical SAM enzyme